MASAFDIPDQTGAREPTRQAGQPERGEHRHFRAERATTTAFHRTQTGESSVFDVIGNPQPASAPSPVDSHVASAATHSRQYIRHRLAIHGLAFNSSQRHTSDGSKARESFTQHHGRRTPPGDLRKALEFRRQQGRGAQQGQGAIVFTLSEALNRPLTIGGNTLLGNQKGPLPNLNSTATRAPALRVSSVDVVSRPAQRDLYQRLLSKFCPVTKLRKEPRP